MYIRIFHNKNIYTVSLNVTTTVINTLHNIILPTFCICWILEFGQRVVIFNLQNVDKH